jgi:hypothetical protein
MSNLQLAIFCIRNCCRDEVSAVCLLPSACLSYPHYPKMRKKEANFPSAQNKECLPFIAVPVSTVKKAGIRNCHTALTNNV